MVGGRGEYVAVAEELEGWDCMWMVMKKVWQEGEGTYDLPSLLLHERHLHIV